MNFYTSDLHLNHRKIIKYCNRPFNSIEDHNKTLIQNINSLVQKNDSLYILGDFVFGKAKYWRERINCNRIFALYGNHCNRNDMDQAGFEWVKDVAEIYDYNKRIYLSHYAMLRWPASHRGSLHLFGHSHGKLLNPAPNSLDVGVDCWDYKPVTLKQILEKLCQN